MTCPCPDPRVFGHRADCPHGHAWVQSQTTPVTTEQAQAWMTEATQRQAQWDRPLTTEGT